MIKLVAWIAAAGLMAIAPFASVTVAFAQSPASTDGDILEVAPSVTPEATSEDPSDVTPSDVTPSDVTEFLIDYGPNECTVQLGYFEDDDFALVGTQSVETLLAENPLLPCNSVTGSDNGITKNFNFVSDSSSSVYKIITASEPVSAERSPNEFTVLAIQIIPIGDEGVPKPEEIIQLGLIHEGTCEVDAIEETHAAVCEFTFLSDTPSAAMGRLSYGW